MLDISNYSNEPQIVACTGLGCGACSEPSDTLPIQSKLYYCSLYHRHLTDSQYTALLTAAAGCTDMSQQVTVLSTL